MLFTGKGAKWKIKSSNQFQMVHHSCSAFPCECFAYFLFRKLLSAGSNINSAAMCLCHIYYRNADSSVTFNQLDGTNANFREEAISLQAKSKAQQESIEALSAAYAQQRKLTHDFLAHLSTLDGMLMQQNRDINTIQTYIHSLQSKQNERILLVNTHHAALDALLNQKALVAKNRKIDIQFSVNDLSPIKIDMVDLTVVISNTLDNAIEACEKLPETDRQIYVQALLEEDELFYAVRNKSLPVNMIANQLPTSTKENPSFHGYGLQNVHTTLEKYHTLYAMDYENGWFEFATELPNTLIS